MADEQEQREEPPPFDENPPVDPSEPRVGNSKAVFVQPDEEEASEKEQTGDEEETAGQSQRE
jgi:hypothetical protein